MNRPAFVVLNALFLYLCASMYLGTGWSLWLFSFQVTPHLTPANYYYAFVPQVVAAAKFFTYMTALMGVSGLLLAWQLRHAREKWAPILTLVAVTVATWLTIQYIFPYNHILEGGVKDGALLQETLTKWINLNKVRISLWSVQWVAMGWLFYRWSVAALKGGGRG